MFPLTYGLNCYTLFRLASGFIDRVRFMVSQVALGRVLLSTSVLPCQHHSTNSPYSYLSTCCPYQKGEQAKHENRPGSVVCRVSTVLGRKVH